MSKCGITTEMINEQFARANPHAIMLNWILESWNQAHPDQAKSLEEWHLLLHEAYEKRLAEEAAEKP